MLTESSIFWLAIYGYLGLIAGYFLTRISPEEMKPGNKYFKIGKIVIVFLIGVFTLYLGTAYCCGFKVIFPLVFGLILGMLFDKIYLILGFGIALASGNFATILASLIFLFGMFEASFSYDKNYLFNSSMFYFLPVLIILSFNLDRFISSNAVLAIVGGYALSYAYKSLKN
jgi:hypothetical protein